MRRALVPLLLSTVGPVGAQDFDWWEDRTFIPPFEQIASLPLASDDFGGDQHHHLGDKVLERDGLEYKAVQFFRDAEFTVEAQVGQYVLGWIGQFYPKGTFDGEGWLRSTELTLEINGQAFPIAEEDQVMIPDFPSGEDNLWTYMAFPRFLTPGEYTLKYRWRQLEPFFWVFPFGHPLIPHLPADPLGFEGRRVYVPEEDGEILDGEFVLTYHLTVVGGEQTAVAPSTWGQVKTEATR